MNNMEMTEERAREILSPQIWSESCSSLFLSKPGLALDYVFGAGYAVIDGCVTADELEAIAFLMRNKGGEDGRRDEL